VNPINLFVFCHLAASNNLRCKDRVGLRYMSAQKCSGDATELRLFLDPNDATIV